MWFWLFYCSGGKTMDSAKRCREQSAQCLSLSREAQSETKERSLRAMSDSWVRLANQIDRYQQLRSSEPDRASPNQIDILIGQPGSERWTQRRI
jgi:hypothetical protein